ncbi:hypothetical protein ACFPRL_18585 [Pseudoclavibacter helvolus]
MRLNTSSAWALSRLSARRSFRLSWGAFLALSFDFRSAIFLLASLFSAGGYPDDHSPFREVSRLPAEKAFLRLSSYGECLPFVASRHGRGGQRGNGLDDADGPARSAGRARGAGA